MSDDVKPPPPPPPPPKPARPTRSDDERRKFLRAAVVGAGVVGLSMTGLLPVLLEKRPRLRPPGALDEKDLLAACIKCGQCVQVCPVEALAPASILDGFGIGVPFIDPRRQACDFACDVGQCILACPTGALAYHKPDFLPVRPGAELPESPVLAAKISGSDPTLQFKERMGVARLARPEACWSVLNKPVQGPTRGEHFSGKKRYVEVDRWKPMRLREHAYQLERCDLCVRECPIEGAIRIEERTGPDGQVQHVPTVLAQCVGCGTCEMVCPAEPAAIVIDPRKTWEGA